MCVMALMLATAWYAPVNGLQLYYEIRGKPAKDGVPLVLLHGAAPPSRPRLASSSRSSRRRDR